MSHDGTNRLTLASVKALIAVFQEWTRAPEPLIVTGNEKCFSAGRRAQEIRDLNGPAAYDFSRIGQHLMHVICNFPSPVYAAISGYCLGGGLDLALACHRRIAAPNAVFWASWCGARPDHGVGRDAETSQADGESPGVVNVRVCREAACGRKALELGLVDCVAENPVADAALRIIAAARPAVDF